jgi:hypothetical protein
MNFKNGKIYKVWSPTSLLKDCYVGSTCKSLQIRLRGHKNDYKVWQEGLRDYLTSFEVVKRKDVMIELLEKYPCKSRKELRIREQYWIDKLPNSVNKCKAYRSDAERKAYHSDYNKKPKQIALLKEWYQKNKEVLKMKHKEYNEANKEKISLQKKEYYKRKKLDLLSRVNI